MALIAVAPHAQAQPEVPLADFSVVRFSPAPGPTNYFMVESAQTPGHLEGSAGLIIDYGHLPFVLYDASCDTEGANCTIGGTRAELVQYTATAHLTGSFVLFDRVQIAAMRAPASAGDP